MTLPTLQTKRLHLRQPNMRDSQDIYDYMKHGEVQQYMPNEPQDYTMQHAENKVKSLQELNQNPEKAAWAIEHLEDETMIGIIDIEKTPHHRRLRIGYHLSPDYQRRGLMSEAVKKVISHAFNDLNAHKITADIAEENKPSRSFIETIGFTQEGKHRDELFITNKFHDILHYGLLATEWDP